MWEESSRVSSAPTIVRRPSGFAACASSIAPWRPSWSVMASAECPCSAAVAASSIGCEAPSRNENDEWQWSSTYGMVESRPLLEPAARDQVPEHDRVAAVVEDDLEVAPPQRPAGPPPILHHPVLEDALDRAPRHGHGRAVASAPDRDRERVSQAPDRSEEHTSELQSR